MTGLSVKEYTEDVREAWDDFVMTHPEGTAYHSRAWQDIVARTYRYPAWHLTAVDSANTIHGVLPMVRLRSRLFGDFMLSLPYVNYCGALTTSADADRLLMQRAGEIAAACGVSHVEFRDRRPRDGWPARTNKVEMILELAPTADEQWSGLSSKLRAQVRRPQRENVEVLTGREELVPAFYRVFSRNMRDLGTPVYSKRFFVEMCRGLGERSEIVVVLLDGKPAAAGFLIHHPDTTEIPSASSLRQFNRYSVNMLLYWECLKRAIERGARYFDFGRCTPGSGTHRFKKQWGAQPQALYWHYWLDEGRAMPALNPDNDRFALAIRAWQKLPVWAANLIGPRIVRNLP